MAEIEYSGIKIGGSKLLLIVPLVGTIVGGLWGGFELYSRYLSMEEQISAYVAPDLSGIEATVALFKQDNEATKELVIDMRNSTREDIATLYKNLDKQDLRNRANVESVRSMITAFEGRLADKMARLDDQIDGLEEKLDLRIKRALENPLNN
jgi:hypothetical protein|tara:strand:- start:420 stop:875 length:456 start_codon:yes stop_codon:yes gene_type:complete